MREQLKGTIPVLAFTINSIRQFCSEVLKALEDMGLGPDTGKDTDNPIGRETSTEPVGDVPAMLLKIEDILRREEVLIIIDQLKRFQTTSDGEVEAEIDDEHLRKFIENLTAWNKGMCVVTSRLELKLPTPADKKSYAQEAIPKFEWEESLALFRAYEIDLNEDVGRLRRWALDVCRGLPYYIAILARIKRRFLRDPARPSIDEPPGYLTGLGRT